MLRLTGIDGDVAVERPVTPDLALPLYRVLYARAAALCEATERRGHTLSAFRAVLFVE